MFTNKMGFPLLLIVLLGLQDCHSLNCFQCVLTQKSGKDEGEAGCDKVKGLTPPSQWAKACSEATMTHCSYITYATGLNGDTTAFIERSCTAKTEEGCHDITPPNPKYPEGTQECVCAKDDCNDADIAKVSHGPAPIIPTTPSSAMTMVTNCAVLKALLLLSMLIALHHF